MILNFSTLCFCQAVLEDYLPNAEAPAVGSLMAVLAVIGGIDDRLRLGGPVVHEEYGEGTVTRITPKGRITVQFHEMRNCKVCLLSQLKPVHMHQHTALLPKLTVLQCGIQYSVYFYRKLFLTFF